MLKRTDLLTLEQYAIERDARRQAIIALKKNRQLSLGAHVRLLFENKATIAYQVQEVLRIEKIFEGAEIDEELSAYNPLIPTGANLKAILMIEYSDASARKKALAQLIDIEKTISIQVGNHAPVFAVCNEDLSRQTDEKTSAVHFMRFEFTTAMIADFKNGLAVVFKINHTNYQHCAPIPANVQQALSQDFD